MVRNVNAKRRKVDRISRLPEEILIAIISCLPVKDAVRTGILSSHWRNFWKDNPHLDFDAKGAKYTTHQYAELVDNAIQAYESPVALSQFRVCFDLDSSWQSTVEEWVKYAFARKVHRLELDLSDCYYYGRVVPKVDEEKCVFRSKLLPNDRDLSSPGFDSLKVLSLKDVNVSGKALQVYLTQCPFLEQLVVWGSGTLKKLKISDPSLKLKHLEIRNCQELACLKVRNVNLRSLSVEISSYGKLKLENLTTLVDVCITSNCTDFYNHVFDMLHDCLPQLKVLTLCGGKPKELVKVNLFPELLKLKTLVLRFWADRNKDFLQLVSCIHAAPMLEEFVLELMWTHLCKRESHVEEVAGTPHQFLRVVKICGYSGRPSELELVRYIVQNALVLKKMVVDTRRTRQYSAKEEMEGVQSRRRDHVTQQLLAEVPGHVQLVIL